MILGNSVGGHIVSPLQVPQTHGSISSTGGHAEGGGGEREGSLRVEHNGTCTFVVACRQQKQPYK